MTLRGIGRQTTLAILLLSTPAFAATEIAFGPPRKANPDEKALVPIVMKNQPIYVVPIFLTDNPSGDGLGVDGARGDRIQVLSLSVRFVPAGLVWGAAFERAGITNGLKATFEKQMRTYSSASWLAFFEEVRSPLNTGPGRTLVANLVLTSPPDIGRQPITLSFDQFATSVGNQGGTKLHTSGHGLQVESATIIVP